MNRDQSSAAARSFVLGAGWRITHSSNLRAYAPGQVVRIEPDPGEDRRYALAWDGPDGRSHRLCGLAFDGHDRLRGIDDTGAYRVLVEQPVGAGRIFVKVSCSLGGSVRAPLSGIWGAEALVEGAQDDPVLVSSAGRALVGRPDLLGLRP